MPGRVPGAPVPAGGPSSFYSPTPGPSAEPRLSTITVQNVLFTLGGLLLVVAASVFTAVAWAQVGVTGRALLLAAATGAILAVPPFAARRGLTAAAETFAAVGLLMILLDGFAAWAVDFLWVRDVDPPAYIAAVLAVTSAVSAGYARLTGLRGPRIAALLLAQPVVPLVAAANDAGMTGWSLSFLGTLVLNIAFLQLRPYRLRGATPTGSTSTGQAATGDASAHSPAAGHASAGQPSAGGSPPWARPVGAGPHPGPGPRSAPGFTVAPAQPVTVNDALRGIALACGAGSAALAGLIALTDVLSVNGALRVAGAGAVLLLTPIALLVWAILSRLTVAQRITSGLILVTTGIVGARWILELPIGSAAAAWPVTRFALVALVLAAVAMLLRPRPSLAGPESGLTTPGDPQPASSRTEPAPHPTTGPGASHAGAGPDAPPRGTGSTAETRDDAPEATRPETGPATSTPDMPETPGTTPSAAGSATPMSGNGPGAGVRGRRGEAGLVDRVRAVCGNGPWIGALIVAAGPAISLLLGLTVAGTRSLEASRPLLDTPLSSAIAGGPGPDALVGLAITIAAFLVLLPRRIHSDLFLIAGAGAALLVPTAFHLLWWSAAVTGLLAGTAALARAARSASVETAILRALLSVALCFYALLIAFGHPGVVAALFAAFALLGAGTARLVRSGPREGDIGTAALLAGLAATGPAVWLALLAADQTVTTQVRASLLVTAALCGAAHLVVRWSAPARGGVPVGPGLSRYGLAALVVALLAIAGTPLWSAPGSDPVVLYSAAALLLAVSLLPIAGARALAGAGAVIPGLTLLALTAGDLAVVVFEPWTAVSGIWSGIAPAQSPVAWSSVGALALAGVAAGGAAWLVRSARAAIKVGVAFAVLLVPLVPAAAGAPWPAVPMAALAGGLAGLTAVALIPVRRVATDLLAVLFGVLAAAGVAGSLAGHVATIVAFTLVVAASVAVGVAGSLSAVRMAGWTTGSIGTVVLAYTIADALDLASGGAALAILLAAALIVALEWVLTSRRPAEAWGPFGVAHASAVLALLTTETLGWAALVCKLWALVLTVRALRPGETGTIRFRYGMTSGAVALLGWWFLLWSRDVGTTEIYTVPAALLALVAGWVARRGRPELPSWAAYGPALAAAFLPSLFVIADSAPDDPQYPRRLLLGVSALAVLLIGARARLQAPVVTGGGVLVLVALHELIQFWDLVPRWVPLAVGGLLLVGIATTIEQRRRDLARLKDAITRMT
ncbi:SCO7613 C-terminal domain-containing membrane protein [Actinoplanes sp. G11-F43]|uniref:SCO7613 C-terminal domain-containing membrane protein n=1 Tax=Actinoplanes sp. G11-F43 TaxID=3424130 RepID=UPI003D335C60